MCNLDCMGEAEGWKEEEDAAILRLGIQGLKLECRINSVFDISHVTLI